MSRAHSSYARLLFTLVFVAAPIVVVAQQSAADAAPALTLADLSIASAAAPAPAPVPLAPPALKRPSALPALYVSFAALQVLDATSTSRALNNGAVEANPALRGVASNPGAMLAVKLGATTATVLLTERLWKKNRTAAIIVMVCANSAYAAIVAHNYRVGSIKR